MLHTELSTFVRAYIECAFWSSMDDDGTPLDGAKYSDAELADETLQRFIVDCDRFEDAITHRPELEGVAELANSKQVAHDFWLTRNHHGAGFWDGDYPEPAATILTDIAHSFGECDLYVGDDGKIYAA